MSSSKNCLSSFLYRAVSLSTRHKFYLLALFISYVSNMIISTAWDHIFVHFGYFVFSCNIYLFRKHSFHSLGMYFLSWKCIGQATYCLNVSVSSFLIWGWLLHLFHWMFVRVNRKKMHTKELSRCPASSNNLLHDSENTWFDLVSKNTKIYTKKLLPGF